MRESESERVARIAAYVEATDRIYDSKEARGVSLGDSLASLARAGGEALATELATGLLRDAEGERRLEASVRLALKAYERLLAEASEGYGAPSGYEATYEYVAGLSDSELADITRAAESVRAARDAANRAEAEERKRVEFYENRAPDDSREYDEPSEPRFGVKRAYGAARYASELAYGVAVARYLANGDDGVPVSDQFKNYARLKETEQLELTFPEYLAGVGFGPKAAERFYRAVDEAYEASDPR